MKQFMEEPTLSLVSEDMSSAERNHFKKKLLKILKLEKLKQVYP